MPRTDGTQSHPVGAQCSFNQERAAHERKKRGVDHWQDRMHEYALHEIQSRTNDSVHFRSRACQCSLSNRSKNASNNRGVRAATCTGLS